jgi:hypothetical protein
MDITHTSKVRKSGTSQARITSAVEEWASLREKRLPTAWAFPLTQFRIDQEKDRKRHQDLDDIKSRGLNPGQHAREDDLCGSQFEEANNQPK